jgi:hypothetical protein
LLTLLLCPQQGEDYIAEPFETLDTTRPRIRQRFSDAKSLITDHEPALETRIPRPVPRLADKLLAST